MRLCLSPFTPNLNALIIIIIIIATSVVGAMQMQYDAIGLAPSTLHMHVYDVLVHFTIHVVLLLKW